MWEPIRQWLLEPSHQQLIVGVFSACALGIIIGLRAGRRKDKKHTSIADKSDKAFLKGIHYLLSNDHNQAIEEFAKSVKINSETIETYVALGNLYRNKGDIDRAIRIRQSIILRPNIDEEIKIRALFDLGLDFKKGGFLDRALNTFLEVLEKNPSHVETLEEIEKIYEELRDWENAYEGRKRIATLTKGDHRHILAHHLVEIGKDYEKDENLSKAIAYFNKAISTDKKCADAYLHLGDIQLEKREYRKAISTWKRLVEVVPQFAFLAYGRLEKAYLDMKNPKPIEDFLRECAKLNPDRFMHMAFAWYHYNEKDIEGVLREIRRVLELDPLFWEARKLRGKILLSEGREKEALIEYADLIEQLDVPYLLFQCSECGFEPNGLQWQCPQCKRWDTIRLIDSPGSNH